MRSRWGSRIGRDTGSVTAEFALVIPAVVLVLGCCLGAIQVVGQQVRMTDAAAGAARALGRGESSDHAAALANGAVPGVALSAESRGEFVCATLSAPSGIGPFALVGLTVTAVSCAPAGGL